MGCHRCWKNKKENSERSDREIVVTKKRGNKIYLLKDEEAYIVATSEIYGAHELPRDIQTFNEELQQVLRDVFGRSIGCCIKPSSE